MKTNLKKSARLFQVLLEILEGCFYLFRSHASRAEIRHVISPLELFLNDRQSYTLSKYGKSKNSAHLNYHYSITLPSFYWDTQRGLCGGESENVVFWQNFDN